MTTTRYVTGDGVGALTLLARAVDPNGNPIVQQTTITVNQLPQIPKCYNTILTLSPTQNTIESACAQFGVANTYYLGNPRNTIYSTDDCSQIISDGFYKTENGNWVNISGGTIKQQGSCASVERTASIPTNIGPQRFNTGGVTNAGLPAETTTFTNQPIPLRLPSQVREVFVPQPVFTQPAPSLTPPDPVFVAERAAFKAAQKAQQTQPTLTTITNTTETIPVIQNAVPVEQPTFVPAEASPIDFL